MELWIRSQDRGSLVKVDNLYVSVGNYICYYVEKGKEIPNTYYRPSGELGRYKTKERALEVLDEIQNILKPQLIIKNSGKIIGSFEDTLVREGATYELKELWTSLYQMTEKERKTGGGFIWHFV